MTYLQGSFPVAGSEVSVAAKRVCSARNRPRALPPLPGPLAGAPPGGRTLLPSYLLPSLFLPLLPSFLLSRHCLGAMVSGIACPFSTYLINNRHPSYRCHLLCGAPLGRHRYAKPFTPLISSQSWVHFTDELTEVQGGKLIYLGSTVSVVIASLTAQ